VRNQRDRASNQPGAASERLREAVKMLVVTGRHCRDQAAGPLFCSGAKRAAALLSITMAVPWAA
jgi:hypothetical protein